MRRLSSFLGSLAATALLAGPALANTEVITTYDARSAGMGYTGTAYIDNAAAILTNPANLTNIKGLDVTLHFSPDFTGVKTPYLGAGSTAQAPTYARSKLLVTPLAFVGLGYKLRPGVSMGLAAQITQVKGVLFSDTPLSLTSTDAASAAFLGQLNGSVSAAQLFWEVRAPIAIDLAPWLTISAGYRMGFFHQGVKVHADATNADLNKQSFHGSNFLGAQAGILFKPSHDVRFGLSYRSKMTLASSGDVTAPDPRTGQNVTTKVKTGAPYKSPHMFTAGLALKFLQHRLTFAGDFKYWMYKDAYTGVHPYRDAMSGHIGAEYLVTSRVPLRAGYVIGLSATRKDFASPVDTTPGLQHAGTLGTGYHFDNVDVDLGVGYGASNTNVEPSTTALGGNYKLDALLVNLSATVHI